MCWCKVCADAHVPSGGLSLKGRRMEVASWGEDGGPVLAIVWFCVSSVQGPRGSGDQAPSCMSRTSFLGNVNRAFPM